MVDVKPIFVINDGVIERDDYLENDSFLEDNPFESSESIIIEPEVFSESVSENTSQNFYLDMNTGTWGEAESYEGWEGPKEMSYVPQSRTPEWHNMLMENLSGTGETSIDMDAAYREDLPAARDYTPEVEVESYEEELEEWDFTTNSMDDYLTAKKEKEAYFYNKSEAHESWYYLLKEHGLIEVPADYMQDCLNGRALAEANKEDGLISATEYFEIYGQAFSKQESVWLDARQAAAFGVITQEEERRLAPKIAESLSDKINEEMIKLPPAGLEDLVPTEAYPIEGELDEGVEHDDEWTLFVA